MTARPAGLKRLARHPAVRGALLLAVAAVGALSQASCSGIACAATQRKEGAVDPSATATPAALAASTSPTSNAPPPVDPTRTVAPMPSLAPLVKQLQPSVVNIYTTQIVRSRRGRMMGGDDEMEEFFRHFFGGGPRAPRQESRRQALGSGFLIEGGLALTNNHVIDGADEIKVKLSDGREFEARLVGRDAATDVALLELKGEAARQLPAVRLGDSDAISVGDYVVAIGNPFGLSQTVTSGIVSAKERVIGAGPYDDFIQTDASINPGNSGGPLFNLQGEVVGVNTAIVAKGQGIGFAVPVNMVKQLLPQLRDRGHVSRGWLGVGLQDMTPELARSFGIAGGKGALVGQVVPGGPASRGGVQPGDVVVEFNGKPIDSAGSLTRAIGTSAPSGEVGLKLLRDGKPVELKIKLGERDENGVVSEGGAPGREEKSGGVVIGLELVPAHSEAARRMGVREAEGLVVTDVLPGGAAEAAGLQPGDVILDFQRRPVPTVDQFRQLAQAVKPGETVLFRVARGGSVLFLAAQAPRR